MDKRVKKIALSVVLCAALLLCSGGVTTADPPPSQVFVVYVCGDKLVYDAVHDVYFYPHLLNMLNMTKPQQQVYCDQLNANAYGQITDWHFANLEQMMGLLESMTGHTIIPGIRNNAPCSPSTDTFFPVTGITQPWPYRPPMAWTMGRTIDEAGVLIQVPDGITYGGVPLDPEDYGEEMYLTTVPTEGQYHWVGTDYLTFDNDLNWVADDALIGPSPIEGDDDIPCSAWYVSETGPPLPKPNSKYLHSEGGLINITDPVGTQWHELWPFFCKRYHLSSWNDTSGDGVLSRCDWIHIYEKPDGALKPYHVEKVTITLNVTHTRETLWHVEGVATDIIVTPEIPPVGGEAYPVSKISVLAPWIAVAVLLAGGAIWYVLRRRKAGS